MRWCVLAALMAMVLLTSFGCRRTAGVATRRADVAPVDLRGAVRTVSTKDAESMVWSPDGHTLAFIDRAVLHTLNPDRSLQLPIKKGTNWTEGGWGIVRWRPDGKQMLAVGEDAVVVVDAGSWSIVKRFERDQTIWWFGNELATSKFVDPSGVPPSYVRTWTAGGVTHRLPAGMSVEDASLDGTALLATEPTDTYLWLLLLDPRSGEIVERRKLRSPGRLDLDGGQVVDWNAKRRLAAYTADQSGGGTFYSYVSAAAWETQMQLYEPAGGSAVYPWSGRPHWLDDRRLFVKLDVVTMYMSDQKTERKVQETKLAIYDAETGRIRPVYESAKMVEAAASVDFVAILERKGNEERIVVSEWEKTSDGVIVRPKYHASDEPEDADYARFLTHPEKPLPRKR